MFLGGEIFLAEHDETLAAGWSHLAQVDVLLAWDMSAVALPVESVFGGLVDLFACEQVGA